MIPLNENLSYLTAFSGGILLSLTPCVYPLIPITAGYIGASSGGSRLKGFILSLVYVSGLAVAYSLLGLAASLTGKIFGAISINPITRIATGVIVILFGLSMLDLFTFPLPNIIKAPVFKKRGYFSVFLLGLSSALLISPCVTPALGSILICLAQKKNIFYGMTLLFSFAYGMGLLLILVGTFSAVLLALPKSGKWMAYIKKACAIIIMAVGVYFIYNSIRGM